MGKGLKGTQFRFESSGGNLKIKIAKQQKTFKYNSLFVLGVYLSI